MVMMPEDVSSTTLKVFPSRMSTLAGWTCAGSSGLIPSVPSASIRRIVRSDRIMIRFLPAGIP